MRDATAVEAPTEFRPSRTQTLTPFGAGMHSCGGREVALALIGGLVKLAAGLKELRPAPGTMGMVKSIVVGTERSYLNESWSYLTFEASTWKVHCSSLGKGVWRYPEREEREKKRRRGEKDSGRGDRLDLIGSLASAASAVSEHSMQHVENIVNKTEVFSSHSRTSK